MAFHPNDIRPLFPVLHQQVNGKPLIYLDNAASQQKPQSVINALAYYYANDHSNIHRAAHTLANRATAQYEETREKVAQFIHAAESRSCIFTKGTTESINLVAQSYGEIALQKGDEVLISEMEHHSNIVPWQMICAKKGAILKAIPIHDDGSINLEAFKQMLNARTRIVACTWMSNAMGVINPIEKIIHLAHQTGAKVLIDGAQAVAHMGINVQELNVDFLAFSAHKMYGPTGVGVLYAKSHLLEAMPPFLGGGEMIREVKIEHSTWNEIPYKFEAGTPNIADVIAFKKAIEFIQQIGILNIQKHEESLCQILDQALKNISVKRIGHTNKMAAVRSFVFPNLHHFDAGMLFDAKGIAVRTGHHCAQPLMKRMGIDGTVRASFAIYNTVEEVHTLIETIEKLSKLNA